MSLPEKYLTLLIDYNFSNAIFPLNQNAAQLPNVNQVNEKTKSDVHIV